MNYSIHENGWTVLADVDLKTITQDEVNQLARLIASNTCVVIRNQFLTVEEEMHVINMFKNPEVLLKNMYPKNDTSNGMWKTLAE